MAAKLALGGKPVLSAIVTSVILAYARTRPGTVRNGGPVLRKYFSHRQTCYGRNPLDVADGALALRQVRWLRKASAALPKIPASASNARGEVFRLLGVMEEVGQRPTAPAGARTRHVLDNRSWRRRAFRSRAALRKQGANACSR